MIVDNTEYIKFNFPKSSAGTIHIVKDREKLEENSCISLRKMTYEHCHDLARSSKSVMDQRTSMFSFSFETDLHIPELYLFPTAYSAFPQHIWVALKKKIAPQTMWEINQFSELLSVKYLIVSLK